MAVASQFHQRETMADLSCRVCFVKKSLIFVTEDGNEIEKLKTTYIESFFSTIERRITSLRVTTSSHSVTNPSEAQSPTHGTQEVTCLGCNAMRPPSYICCPNCNNFLCSNCANVVDNVSKFLTKDSEQQNQVTNVKIKLQELCKVNVNIECNEHKGEVCVLICEYCNSKSICVRCIKSSEHNGHTSQNVNQVVDKSKTNFYKYLEKFQSYITDLYAMVEKIEKHIGEKTDIECNRHKKKLCLFMCTHQECNTKRVCIDFINEEPNDHYFQTIIKLSNGDGENPFNNQGESSTDDQYEMEEIQERVLQEWQEFAEVLSKQAKESEENIRKRAEDLTRLKEDLRFMVETLNSWTYVKFLPKLERCFEEATKELDVGNFPCEGPRCFTCNRGKQKPDKVKSLIKSVNIIEGAIGCQEILGKFTCHSKDVVYVITCERCGLQYVGETGQMLQTRMNDHRSDINKLVNDGARYIHLHFREGACEGADFNVVGVFEMEDKEKRLAVEAALMLKLGTVKIDLKKDKLNKNDETLRTMPVSPLFKGLNERYIHERAEKYQSMKDRPFSLDKHSYLVEPKSDDNLKM